MEFPAEVRNDIATITENGGVLSAEKCARICSRLSIDIKTLMIRLLPLAESYSKPPISSYKVGAIALCLEKVDADNSDVDSVSLYFGANFEYEFESLSHSLHAEQSAISNAWLHDQNNIVAVAVTAPPCGHCRQFLYELADAGSFEILMPASAASELFSMATDKSEYASIELSLLLPAAFGPDDLGSTQHLLDPASETNQLTLQQSNNDELVTLALRAADSSYAPYTLNFAGCALELNNGKLLSGRYAENAAHNPSLDPISAVLSQAVLNDANFEFTDIRRLVLVEHSTKASQRGVTQKLLASCNHGVELEYHHAVVNQL